MIGFVAKSKTQSKLIVAAAIVAAGLALPGARADDFPGRTIEVVVATPAGSTTDVITRLVTEHMRAHLGQALVINNIPTAAGVVGTQTVARREPNGYTLGAANGSLATFPFLVKDFGFDPVKDFTPICTFGTAPLILLINPTLPAKNLKEFIAHVRANPGKLNYATFAGQTELDLSFFVKMANLDIVAVRYRGGPQGFTAVQTNESQMLVTTLASAKGFMESGAMRGIAVTSSQPFPELTDLPLVESEVPGYVGSLGWTGLYGPAGMPGPVVAKLAAACSAAVREPAVIERFKKLALIPSPDAGSEKTGRQIVTDVENIKKQIAATGIEPR